MRRSYKATRTGAAPSMRESADGAIRPDIAPVLTGPRVEPWLSELSDLSELSEHYRSTIGALSDR